MPPLQCAGCEAPLDPEDATLSDPDASSGGPPVRILRCDRCGHEHRALAGSSLRPDPRASFGVGSPVAAEWGGLWWPARVQRIVVEDVWEVRFEGWPSKRGEVMDVSRVRARGRHVSPRARATFALAAAASVTLGLYLGANLDTGAAAATDSVLMFDPDDTVSEEERAARGPIRSTGEPVPEGLLIRDGTPLEVRWNESYYRAVAKRDLSNGAIDVHYVGWGESFDETVDVERVRISVEAIEASRGPVEGSGSDHTLEDDAPIFPGDVLEVRWRDGWYRAVVDDVRPEGTLRVHYAGWEERFDEEIPRSRARRVLYTPGESGESGDGDYGPDDGWVDADEGAPLDVAPH